MVEYMKTHMFAKAQLHAVGEQERGKNLHPSAGLRDKLESQLTDGFDPEKDLMKMVSVLVSTGKNKNDDVFWPQDLAAVRASGKHKPVNLEHDSDNIVGCMTRSFATTKDGTELSDAELEKGVPDDFDITNEAVIFAFTKPEVAETVKRLASSNDLFVSVEMWFTDFDYLLGNTMIVKRNQSTSFLDDHLKSNGGDGTYKGEPLGRVLRNMLIGGIGIVEKPANPDSVIRSISSLRSESARDVQVYEEPAIASNIVEDLSHKSFDDKPQTEDEEMKQLFEELAETLKASQKALQEKKDEVEKVEETATAVAADTSGATQEVEATPVDDERIQSLMASVDALAKKNDALTEKIDQMENEKRAAERRVTLASIGLEGKGLQDAFTHSVDFEDFDFRSFCDMVKEIFNQNNLRTQAGEQHESTEEGGTPVEAKAKEEETVGEDNQEDVQATEASEDEDDAVIDMDKLEDEDADLAVESESDPRDLTDEYFDALTSQLEGRNPTWTKIARAKKRQLQEK